MLFRSTLSPAAKPYARDAVINRAHPLARKLEFCVLYEGGRAVDMVRGYVSTPTNTPQQKSIGEVGYGTAFDAPASATCFHNFAATTSDTRFLGDITLMWRGVINSTVAGNTLISKCTSNGATNSPFDWATSGSNTYNCVRSNATSLDSPSTLSNSVVAGKTQTFIAVLPGTNGQSVVMYADGVNVQGAGALVSNAPYTGSSHPIYIGRRDDGGNQLIGSVLLTYVWSRLLSFSEVTQLTKEPYAFFKPRSFVLKGPPPLVPAFVLMPQIVT